MKKAAVQRPKIVTIVAGGQLHKKFLPQIREADVVIGVDRGALWLLKQNVMPHIAIGDFDSVTPVEKRRIHDHAKTYIEYESQKDATDLELAVEEAIRMRPREVRIFGVLGIRFDHALTAIHMLLKLVSHNIYGEIVDNFNKIHIVRHQLRLNKPSDFRYVSIIPLSVCATITLRGFTYNVVRHVFIAGSSLGVSNEILGSSATIWVHKGYVLAIQSRDRAR